MYVYVMNKMSVFRSDFLGMIWRNHESEAANHDKMIHHFVLFLLLASNIIYFVSSIVIKNFSSFFSCWRSFAAEKIHYCPRTKNQRRWFLFLLVRDAAGVDHVFALSFCYFFYHAIIIHIGTDLCLFMRLQRIALFCMIRGLHKTGSSFFRKVIVSLTEQSVLIFIYAIDAGMHRGIFICSHSVSVIYSNTGNDGSWVGGSISVGTRGKCLRLF